MARINVLLLHDWDYHKYSKMTPENDYWFDYKESINTLSNHFSIYRLNFPGFNHQVEPKAKCWNVEDFADFVFKHLTNNLITPDIIIGYGFGADVAIKWKAKYKKKTKIVLISPKLFESLETNTVLDQVTSMLGGFGKKIRTDYDIKKEQIPELVNGNVFLQNTYYKIKNIGLINELITIPVNDIIIFYGANDQSVDSLRVFNQFTLEYRSRIVFIKDANHDLLKTNYQDIINNIKILFGIN